MDENELPELKSKVVRSAKVLKLSKYDHELCLEFEDGTCFSFSCGSRVNSDSCLYRGGIGEPEIIRRVEID